MTTLVSDFPPELITEILLRLPVKSILKFRRVCREWRNIIDSKNFVNMHLTHNEKNPDCLIIDCSWRSYVFYSVDLKSNEEAVILDVRPWWPKDRLYRCGVKIQASSNGLLCCSSFWKNIALWNPSTKKHLMLPPLSFDDDLQLADEFPVYDAAIGFGFDSAVGDYKVVSILHHCTDCGTLLGTEVKVFSLRSNLWRRVHGLPEGLSIVCSEGVCVKESLYWLLKDRMNGYSTSILVFDLKTDKLHILSLPSYTNDDLVMNMAILAIEGCLSINLFYKNVGFEVWVMDDHETVGSWTKLISIHDPNISSYYKLLPMKHRKDVGMLLVADTHDCHTKLVWYDFETKAFEEVSLRGLPEHFLVSKLLSESLVSLDADEL